MGGAGFLVFFWGDCFFGVPPFFVCFVLLNSSYKKAGTPKKEESKELELEEANL